MPTWTLQLEMRHHWFCHILSLSRDTLHIIWTHTSSLNQDVDEESYATFMHSFGHQKKNVCRSDPRTAKGFAQESRLNILSKFPVFLPFSKYSESTLVNMLRCMSFRVFPFIIHTHFWKTKTIPEPRPLETSDPSPFTSFTDSSCLPVPVKEIGSTKLFAISFFHPPNGRFVRHSSWRGWINTSSTLL